MLTNAPRSCVCQKNFVPLRAEILITEETIQELRQEVEQLKK